MLGGWGSKLNCSIENGVGVSAGPISGLFIRVALFLKKGNRQD